MVEVTPDKLKQAVETRYGGKAKFVQFVPIHEERDGQTVWDGTVAVFDLRHQPDGHFRAYAWSYERLDGKQRFVAVLHGPNVKTPRDAVKAAIAAEARAGK